jgi:hypothetical protein
VRDGDLNKRTATIQFAVPQVFTGLVYIEKEMPLFKFGGFDIRM